MMNRHTQGQGCRFCLGYNSFALVFCKLANDSLVSHNFYTDFNIDFFLKITNINYVTNCYQLLLRLNTSHK